MGPVTQSVLWLDVSSAYGEQDGSTQCGSYGSFTSPVLSYLDYTSSTLTVQSSTPADAPSLQTITLTVYLANDQSIQSTTTITVELICQV